MEITFTPAARQFLQSRQATAVTVSSLVISSCCSGPLAPEVKPEPPADADGFTVLPTNEVTLYYDSLLPHRSALTIDLHTFGRYQELFVQGWE